MDMNVRRCNDIIGNGDPDGTSEVKFHRAVRKLPDRAEKPRDALTEDHLTDVEDSQTTRGVEASGVLPRASIGRYVIRRKGDNGNFLGSNRRAS